MALTVRQSYLLGTTPEAARTVAPAILRRAVMSQQPQYAAQIDWSNPLSKNLKHVFTAPNGVKDQLNKDWTLTTSEKIATQSGVSLRCNASSNKYATKSVTLPPASWTIAAVFVPKYYATSGHAIVGFCEAPNNATQDRCIVLTAGGLSAQIYDGASKLATVAGSPLAGVPEICVVTCNGGTLNFYRKGAGVGKGTVAVSNYGYAAYSSPELCIGAASAVAGESDVVLAIQANEFWNDAQAWGWINNPYQIFLASNSVPWVSP